MIIFNGLRVVEIFPCGWMRVVGITNYSIFISMNKKLKVKNDVSFLVE